MSNYIVSVSEYNKFSKLIELDDGSYFKISNKLYYLNKLKENTDIDNFEEIKIKCIYPSIK